MSLYQTVSSARWTVEWTRVISASQQCHDECRINTCRYIRPSAESGELPNEHVSWCHTVSSARWTVEWTRVIWAIQQCHEECRINTCRYIRPSAVPGGLSNEHVLYQPVSSATRNAELTRVVIPDRQQCQVDCRMNTCYISQSAVPRGMQN